MDITFNCERCSQHITIDETGAGQLVDCPNCGTPLEVPYKSKAAILTPAMPPKLPPIPAPLPAEHSRKLCPQCGSDNIIKASAAYEQGTSIIAGTSQQLGGILLHDSDGGLGVAPAVSGGSFRGVQQTSLAKRLAPPVAPKRSGTGDMPIALGVGLNLLGLFCVIVAWQADEEKLFKFILGACLLAVGVVLEAIGARANKASRRADVENMKSYNAAMQEWMRLWYCTKCGNTSRI